MLAPTPPRNAHMAWMHAGLLALSSALALSGMVSHVRFEPLTKTMAATWQGDMGEGYAFAMIGDFTRTLEGKALDRIGLPRKLALPPLPMPPAPAPLFPAELPPRATALVKHLEERKLAAYRDAAGILTIGYGHTGGVAAKSTVTAHEADVLLDGDLHVAEDAVRRHVRVKLNVNEFSALVSLVFNIGEDAFAQFHRPCSAERNERHQAALAFLSFNKARVRGEMAMLSGLVRRRRIEEALFLRAPDKTANGGTYDPGRRDHPDSGRAAAAKARAASLARRRGHAGSGQFRRGRWARSAGPAEAAAPGRRFGAEPHVAGGLEHHFDQARTFCLHRGFELRVELTDGRRARCLHAHAACELHPVQFRIVQIEHGKRARARIGCAHAGELDVQNRIGAVGEDHRGDVELFARLVHSACSVYMPPPSPCKATTLRPGHATAAPAASGTPWPMEPPVSERRSCGAAVAVAMAVPRPEVAASSETIAPSGRIMRDGLADGVLVELVLRQIGLLRAARCSPDLSVRSALRPALRARRCRPHGHGRDR